MDNYKIQAVIFDMDGVISDTQKLHAKVESDLLGRHDINIPPEEITRKFAGVKTSEFFDELLKNQPKPYNLSDLMAEKWQRMENLASQSIDAVDGSVGLIKTFHSAGLKLAVASASSFVYVERIIKGLGLENYFEILVGGDMVKNGKPNPEIFLLAASKLGVEPENCLVIEDGASGMRAASAAGMKCIGLVESKSKEYPTQNLVLSLREINLEYLDNLI